jgi:hypothetical protein
MPASGRRWRLQPSPTHPIQVGGSITSASPPTDLPSYTAHPPAPVLPAPTVPVFESVSDGLPRRRSLRSTASRPSLGIAPATGAGHPHPSLIRHSARAGAPVAGRWPTRAVGATRVSVGCSQRSAVEQPAQHRVQRSARPSNVAEHLRPAPALPSSRRARHWARCARRFLTCDNKS